MKLTIIFDLAFGLKNKSVRNEWWWSSFGFLSMAVDQEEDDGVAAGCSIYLPFHLFLFLAGSFLFFFTDTKPTQSS